MKTIRRFLYRETAAAIGFVLTGFLALFLFFDLVDELPALGKASPLDPGRIYHFKDALLYVGLFLPNNIYELLPIAVLIGTVFVLARLAQSSEFTILRTSGLGPWTALRLLLGMGLALSALTFVVGDYLAPLSNRMAQLHKARFDGRISVGQTGAWLKEKQTYSQYSVNVGSMDANGDLHRIRIYEFDNRNKLVSTLQADRAVITGDTSWELHGVQRSEFNTQSRHAARIAQIRQDSLFWSTELSSEMVAAALLKPERMRTVDLFNYIRHLQANNQSAQRYEIEFWRKVFYPLSCLVMVVLALPFAYLHFRSGGVSAYVFAGVMIGISFFLLNNVFGYIGNLRAWQPWLAAAAPSILYSLASLVAFGWLVLRR